MTDYWGSVTARRGYRSAAAERGPDAGPLQTPMRESTGVATLPVPAPCCNTTYVWDRLAPCSRQKPLVHLLEEAPHCTTTKRETFGCEQLQHCSCCVRAACPCVHLQRRMSDAEQVTPMVSAVTPTVPFIIVRSGAEDAYHVHNRTSGALLLSGNDRRGGQAPLVPTSRFVKVQGVSPCPAV
jgi:hypothetical protein